MKELLICNPLAYQDHSTAIVPFHRNTNILHSFSLQAFLSCNVLQFHTFVPSAVLGSVSILLYFCLSVISPALWISSTRPTIEKTRCIFTRTAKYNNHKDTKQPQEQTGDDRQPQRDTDNRTRHRGETLQSESCCSWCHDDSSTTVDCCSLVCDPVLSRLLSPLQRRAGSRRRAVVGPSSGLGRAAE